MTTNHLPVNASFNNNGGIKIGYPAPSRKIHITVELYKAEVDSSIQEIADALIFQHPKKRTYLSHKSLAETFGTPEANIAKVRAYFCEYNIDLDCRDALGRRFELEGIVEDFEKAFHTRLGVYEWPGPHMRISYEGYLYVPEDIQCLICRVEGLTLPVKNETRTPHIAQGSVDTVETKQAGHSPVEYGKAYGFPDAEGKGQCIAIIELGGGFKKSDVKKFFKDNDIDEPKISEVGDAGGHKILADNAEVTLDIQILGALVPRAHLVVYYASSVVEAMRMIITDAHHKPDVVSISWGGAESYFTRDQSEALNQVFYEAALLGITVIASSGDNGAYNGLSLPTVSLPAASWYVLGCGGTAVTLDNETISNEVVWNEDKGASATGGGYSRLLNVPFYQRQALGHYAHKEIWFRGVPDVAANASGHNGYQIVFNGTEMVIGGTSAATPLWAALIAQMNEILGYNLGFINPIFYKLAGSTAFRQITCGNNQLYTAAPYWNPCTGLGSPVGTALLDEIIRMGESSDEENDA